MRVASVAVGSPSEARGVRCLLLGIPLRPETKNPASGRGIVAQHGVLARDAGPSGVPTMVAYAPRIRDVLLPRWSVSSITRESDDQSPGEVARVSLYSPPCLTDEIEMR
jgi:hypothetical protein